MRVVYKKTVMEKLEGAVEHAKAQRRTIHYIELERYEWDQLIKELNHKGIFQPTSLPYRRLQVAMFMGVELRRAPHHTECPAPDVVEVRCFYA